MWQSGAAPLGAAAVLEVSRLAVIMRAGKTPLPVVDGIGFAIAQRRTLGVVGESGSGKTMTALALMGLVPAPGRVEGSIRLDGRELIGQPFAQWRALRGSRLGMIFQEPMSALNPVMTIGAQIGEVLRLHHGLGRKAALARAIGLLDEVGFPAPHLRAAAYPHQLSGGQRQRVMIAMALACRPAVLIADEPTTALDVTIQAQILDLLGRLQDEIGMAMLFVSHNLGVVSEIADDIIVLYAGLIVEQASSGALFENPRHPYTQGLIATLPGLGEPVPRLPTIPGAPGAPRALWRGCRFAERCPKADAQCRAEAPVLIERAPGHAVACFKAGP